MDNADISFGRALGVWARVGLQSFGGPAGQIALMHRVLVEERRWLTEGQFLHALNFCLLLPGPEAKQLAVYAGWLLHGYAGGLAAGVLFVLPGFITVLALSLIYAGTREVAMVGGLLFGLKAVVLAVVAQAIVRLSRRVLRGPAPAAIAAAGFCSLFFLELPFPLVVAGAGAAGLILERLWPRAPSFLAGDEAAEPAPRPRPAGSRRGAIAMAGTLLLLWLGPVIALRAALGPQHVFSQQALFFSKAALVTFGGAYSVLAYVAQQAVHHFGWLSPAEMLDGLGLAETTPGPLILVLEFVGFLGAWRQPGSLPPALAGCIGATLTAWVTFLPSFLLVLAGAPFVERSGRSRFARGALAGISAAVVGVMTNLGLWFALHALFGRVETLHPVAGLRLLLPSPASLDPAALLIALAAGAALIRFRAALLPTLAAGAAAGIIVDLFRRG